MTQQFAAYGYDIVDSGDHADVYVINSCTVTASGDKKTRQMIHRMKRENPGAVIAMTGCFPQAFPEEAQKLSEVDVLVGAGEKKKVLDYVNEYLQKGERIVRITPHTRDEGFEQMSAGSFLERTRAFVKIQDGCEHYCAYCIIPYARGRIRSLPIPTAAEQTRQLAAEGYREIVVTGIEISSWGQDLEGKPELIEAIEAICQGLSPDTRVRLGSLEPRTITPDFCRRAAALPNLCPHFHLSMQSGCDTVLARMNRKYDSNRYYESVTFLHEAYDRPAVTTDLIVGFPGETEEEFQQTLDFIQKCAFSAMHIFPYSKRPGTPAAKLPGQVRNAVKEERAHRAAQIARTMQDTYLDSWVGETVPVLFEEERDGLWRGHTTRYCEVTVQSAQPLHNQLRQVRLTGRDGGALQGVLV